MVMVSMRVKICQNRFDIRVRKFMSELRENVFWECQSLIANRNGQWMLNLKTWKNWFWLMKSIIVYLKLLHRNKIADTADKLSTLWSSWAAVLEIGFTGQLNYDCTVNELHLLCIKLHRLHRVFGELQTELASNSVIFLPESTVFFLERANKYGLFWVGDEILQLGLDIKLFCLTTI